MSFRTYDIVVIGGGAAGFFAAIQAASLNPKRSVIILEKSSHVLSKVKISGGGRCNVTHACFEQKELVGFYPRGQKELLGPFHRFMTFDTIGWFADRGVELKTEDDGRMFPVTDNSQTIIDCFLSETKKLGIEILYNTGVRDFEQDNHGFVLITEEGESIHTQKIILSTGSSNRMWDTLRAKELKIIDPVASLFTFNFKNKACNDLMGLSVPEATVTILQTAFETTGPLLFTHWGFSGPAILKLSAWAARELAAKNYHFKIQINFTGKEKTHVLDQLSEMRSLYAAKFIRSVYPAYVPKRLWEMLLTFEGITEKRWADVSNGLLMTLTENLCAFTAEITGKSTFKEEFVTAGGIDLTEVNMTTLESKKIPGLYFAGECLNIDAVTGGFNFQAAWTTGFIAGSNV